MKSISLRLNVVFVSLVTIVLLVSGAINYFTAKSDLDRRLGEQAAALASRLKLNVPTLLWNFDEKQIDQLLEAEMNEPDVTGILVKSKDALVSGRVRLADRTVKPATKESTLVGNVIKVPLALDDGGTSKTVGDVEFAVSTERRDRALADLLFKIGLQVVVLNLILVATLSYCLRLMVFRPLGYISNALRQIASGDADLTQRLTVKSRDEIGEVAYWFNAFVEQLQGIVAQVVESATGLGRAEESMSSGVEQSAIRSNEQSEIISSMAAAMEEMTVGISHVSDQSGTVSNLSRESGDLASGGNIAVSELVVEMRRISDSVQATSQTIEELGKESEKINSVVNVIKDIADQTNLLALNAAIEAARAGETGRGFAVVADEVRKLAERTSKSTSEINNIIGTVQGGIRESVERMQSGVAAVSSGLECADQAGAVIEKLKESSSRVVAAIKDITLAISEQTSASSDIARRVESIAQLSDESSTAMSETAESARTVKQLVGEMREVVSGFRV